MSISKSNTEKSLEDVGNYPAVYRSGEGKECRIVLSELPRDGLYHCIVYAGERWPGIYDGDEGWAHKGVDFDSVIDMVHLHRHAIIEHQGSEYGITINRVGTKGVKR